VVSLVLPNVLGTASSAKKNEQSAIVWNLLARVGVLVITSPL
jgi:hypothetical protein